MELTDLERSLVEAFEGFEIIDCHEHLMPEKMRVEKPVDVFTLFAHYTRGDLMVAGMTDSDYQALFNRHWPLESRWALFAPYWEAIRLTSYSRAAILAAQRFYGVDDISDSTYVELSAAMREANKPGLYDRVLTDACHIRVALTQCNMTKLDHSALVPLMPMTPSTEAWAYVAHPYFEPNATIHSLDDYLDAYRRYVLRVKSEGAVGMKLVSFPHKEPSREQALVAFESLRNGTVATLPSSNPIKDYVVDQTVAFVAEQEMVIAVHTGYWGDFRMLDPLHIIPILQRHPKARFDVYHLGYPWVREALMLGKGFANVWLNLCWTHIISQRFAMDGLDEAIDLIPSNKLMAFGGDYGLPVEKVYGHLVMAREDIARVLAARIGRKQMTETQAVALAHKWFWDNPKELYRLKV